MRDTSTETFAAKFGFCHSFLTVKPIPRTEWQQSGRGRERTPTKRTNQPKPHNPTYMTPREDGLFGQPKKRKMGKCRERPALHDMMAVWCRQLAHCDTKSTTCGCGSGGGGAAEADGRNMVAACMLSQKDPDRLVVISILLLCDAKCRHAEAIASKSR